MTDDAEQMLREAAYTIELLAEQQAMPDDFYMATLERIESLLAKRAATPSTGRENQVTDALDNARALGDTVQEALTAGAAAIQAARNAANLLKEGKPDEALRYVSVYADGVSSPPQGSVYDDPASALSDNQPAEPSDTSGY